MISAKNDQDVNVIFIDYGYKILTSLEKVYPIGKRFCSEPGIAILCCLDRIEPSDGSWDIMAYESFVDKCQHLETVTFHSSPDDHPNLSTTDLDFNVKKYSVSLKTNRNGILTDIGSLLVQEGVAKFTAIGN